VRNTTPAARLDTGRQLVVSNLIGDNAGGCYPGWPIVGRVSAS
jgi:hypothetical protein